jgi:hypothetical protein
MSTSNRARRPTPKAFQYPAREAGPTDGDAGVPGVFMALPEDSIFGVFQNWVT